MSDSLLKWQWAGYAERHLHRRNLAIHALTNPLFLASSLSLLAAPFTSWWLIPAAIAGGMTAMALQGKTHKLEACPPEPFRGPGDVVARILLEQWITFPRFVLSGGFARAWRTGGGR